MYVRTYVFIYARIYIYVYIYVYCFCLHIVDSCVMGASLICTRDFDDFFELCKFYDCLMRTNLLKL